MDNKKNPKLIEHKRRSGLKRWLCFFGWILLTKKEFGAIQSNMEILREQLRIMIEEPDSMSGIVLSKRHFLNKSMEKAMFYTGLTNPKKTVGFLRFIKPKQT